MNAGVLKEERFSMFNDLISLTEQYKRINQYK